MTWSFHGNPGAGVSLSGATISYKGGAVANPSNIVAVATDSAGNAEALIIPVTITAGSIQINGGPSKVLGDTLSKLAARTSPAP